MGVGRGSVDGGPDTSSGAVGPGQAQNNSYLVCQPGPPLLQTSLAALQGGGCHPATVSSTTSQLSLDARQHKLFYRTVRGPAAY